MFVQGENKEREEIEKKIMPLCLEEEDVENLGEPLSETEFEVLEEEVEQQQYRQEKINFEATGEEKLKTDYLDTQIDNILSDIDKRTMWNEYKNYVDGIVFIELQDATLCRYTLTIYKIIKIKTIKY